MSFSSRICLTIIAEMLGLYRHYRGGIYQLLGIALHTETLERVAVYQCMKSAEKKDDDIGKMYIRPEEMFYGSVVLESGISVRRFKYLGAPHLEAATPR
jgi:hypothetical protein